MRSARSALMKSKQNWHQRQADLPFEEKVRIVVWMQEVSREFAVMNKRKPKPVWDIEDETGNEV